MRERRLLEPIAPDPIITATEIDVRVQLSIDIRRLCGVQSQAGEPTPEQIQTLLLTLLEYVLRAQPFIVDARVTVPVELSLPGEW